MPQCERSVPRDGTRRPPGASMEAGRLLFGLLDSGGHLRHRHQRPRHLVEQQVGILFLGEGLGEQGDNGAVAKLLGQVAGRGVAGHLVMLDALGRRNQREVGGRILLLFAFLHDLLAFLDQAHHALARLGAGILAEQFEAFVDALDLTLGLGQMLLEQFPQLVEPRGLRHLGKRFGQLLLGVENVTQFMEQEIGQSGLVDGRRALRDDRCGGARIGDCSAGDSVKTQSSPSFQGPRVSISPWSPLPVESLKSVSYTHLTLPTNREV